jgi:hypothetical protein
VTIAKTRNLAAIQVDLPCPVIDQDKIVSRAVHFRETQHDFRLPHQSDAGNPACGFWDADTIVRVTPLPDDVSAFTYPQ